MNDESSAVNNSSLAPEAKIKVANIGLCGCGNGGCWIAICENPFREMVFIRIIATKFLHPIIEFVIADAISVTKWLLTNLFQALLIVKNAHLFCVCFHDTRLGNYRMQG